MRDPQAVIDQLFTLKIKYGIDFVCCQDREEMAKYITDYFIAVGKQLVIGKNK